MVAAEMTVPRPGPGEELHHGEPTTPRQAATVILLRGGADALEVLLAKRSPALRFMGGAWVFPGGAVRAGEGEGDAVHRGTAMRELEEEAGIALPDGPASLVKFARWITPAVVRTRFDTHFFLAEAPAGAEPRVDGEECVDAGWYTPRDALAAHGRGDILLVFPTIKQLEQLAGFRSARALIQYAATTEVRPVEPHVVGSGEEARIVLPGDPGYEQRS
jgi:8-oxo-dGTP pyrophosphatase MutT (NUDIX family)